MPKWRLWALTLWAKRPLALGSAVAVLCAAIGLSQTLVVINSLDSLSQVKVKGPDGDHWSLVALSGLSGLQAQLTLCSAGQEQAYQGAHAARLSATFTAIGVTPRPELVRVLERGESALAAASASERASACNAFASALAQEVQSYNASVVRTSAEEYARVQLDVARIRAAGNYLIAALAILALLVGGLVYAGGMAQRARREQARLRRRAESAERAKNEFVGMATHEVLSPLHVLMASVETIRSRQTVSVHEPVFIRLAAATADLHDHVSDMVDFAQLTSGRMLIRRKRFLMQPIVEAVLDQLEGALIEKDLDVHWDPAPSLRRPIWSDPRRIRQILTNLYSNAIKYTPAGSITLDVHIEGDSPILVIRVQDTGCGIDARDREAIFQPFARLPSAPDVKGHGLGLAVVKSLVESMRGQITVDSAPDAGSTFVVRIPVDESVTGGVAGTSARRVVLLVEDRDDLRDAMAEGLAHQGWTVRVAANLAQAKVQAMAGTLDAAVIDHDLPDGIGDDLAQSLRRDGFEGRLVLLSANVVETTRSQGVFDAVLSKPATAKDVLRAIDASI